MDVFDAENGAEVIFRFRWAALQLDALAACYTATAVDHALATLPKDLNAAYGRMLNQIPEAHYQDAIRLLQLLIGAKRPLKLMEVVEALAVDFGPTPTFNPQNRVPRPREILKICPNLVRVDDKSPDVVDTGQEDVSLAHFSVREFLTSTQVNPQVQAQLAIATVETQLAFICLAYLQQMYENDHGGYEAYYMVLRNEHELAEHCIDHWSSHVCIAKRHDEAICSLAAEVLGHKGLLDVLFPSASHGHRITALKAAASTGLERTAQTIQSRLEGQEALNAACETGNVASARLLLKQSNAIQGALALESPFLLACENCHEDIIGLLLETGVDFHKNAVHAANLFAYEGPEEIMSDEDSDYTVGTLALLVASRQGHENIVRMLLQNEVNEPIWIDASMTAALRHGRLAVAEILLDHDANISPGEMTSLIDKNAHLRPACEQTNLALVSLLLRYGADVNSEDGEGVSPLRIAVHRMSLFLLRSLLDEGANRNATSLKS